MYGVRSQSCPRVGYRLLFGCFCFRLLWPMFLPPHITSYAQHTPHANHTHHLHLHATRTIRAVHLTHTALTTHLSHLHNPSHPSYLTHTSHPHHATSTHHTQSSSPFPSPQTRSCSRKSEMAYGLYCALWMHSVLDQVYPIYPKL